MVRRSVMLACGHVRTIASRGADSYSLVPCSYAGDSQPGVAAHAPQHVNKCGEKCTDCKRPHTKIPGKKYKSAGGRVCGQCYHKNKENEEQPPQSASTPPSTPLREVRQPCVPLPPLLSPEQTQQLSSITKAAGFGQQGRSLSAPERASVILQVNALQQLAATPSCARTLPRSQVAGDAGANEGGVEEYR
jgi:hypothetical protein